MSISPDKGAPKNPDDRFTPIIRPTGVSHSEYWDYALAKTEEIGARLIYRCPN